MSVETGDLLDFDEGGLQLMGERDEMGGMKAAVSVLDEVEVLDQQIVLARARPEQGLDFLERGRIDLPPLREVASLAPAASGIDDARRLRRLRRHHAAFIARSIVLPRLAGESAMVMPAPRIASSLCSAPPVPPEMMAPAWPMRRPGGAVVPAMKPTTGFLVLWARRKAAASSSAEPPISPIMTIPLVCSSARYISRQSMKLVPLTGSPPMPIQVD